jgi:shikimate dehydrogenase
VLVAARRPAQAKALVRAQQPTLRTRLVAVALAELAGPQGRDVGLLRDAGVVVNTTPVGMHGEDFLPFAFAATPPDCLFYDLIYTRARTPFLVAARGARRSGTNGLGMLLHQGAVAFEMWTGCPAPLDVMRRALRSAVPPA